MLGLTTYQVFFKKHMKKSILLENTPKTDKSKDLELSETGDEGSENEEDDIHLTAQERKEFLGIFNLVDKVTLKN